MKGHAKRRKKRNGKKKEEERRRGRRKRSITKRQRRWDKGLTRSCVMWYDQRRDCVRSSGLLRCLEPRWFKDEDEASCHLDTRFSNCPPWTLRSLGSLTRGQEQDRKENPARWKLSLKEEEENCSPIRCDDYRISLLCSTILGIKWWKKETKETIPNGTIFKREERTFERCGPRGGTLHAFARDEACLSYINCWQISDL